MWVRLCAPHSGPGDTQRGLGPRLWPGVGSGEGGQDVRRACGEAGPARREQEPRCCSGPAGLWVWSRGLEAGQRLPRPGQSPKHGMLTPTSLPKLAEGHFLCHPPDGHCVREAHSGAAMECNSTGANQVLVPTVQWPELPSPHPWLCPGQQSGPCRRPGLGSLLSDESDWRRDSPSVCSEASPRALTGLRLGPATWPSGRKPVGEPVVGEWGGS